MSEEPTETQQESVVEEQQQQQPQPPQQQQPVTQVAPANAIEGGREVSDKILYVGGLHKSITEDMLIDLFSVQGAVQSVKLLFDKNRQGFHYAFVHYADHAAAEAAFQTLNGRVLANSPIKINWAFQSQQTRSTESNYNLFIGDLSSEINDEILRKAFQSFPSLTQAHVMWDMQTGRSRGYGFVSFADHQDAERALATMNGEWIGGRAVRLNWASHRDQHRSQHQQQIQLQQQQSPLLLAPQVVPQQFQQEQLPQQQSQPQLQQFQQPLSYDIVVRQTPSWQTTVYLGNLAQYTSQAELISLLQNFGYIVDFKFYPERGCAFVKYDSHERAAVAIVQLTGFNINGRSLKCGWGKERPSVQYQSYGRMMYPQKQFN